MRLLIVRVDLSQLSSRNLSSTKAGVRKGHKNFNLKFHNNYDSNVWVSVSGSTLTPLKNVSDISVPSRDVTYQTLLNLIIPAQAEFSSDIPDGGGNVANLFTV
jgi:hypothetical protein